MDCMESHFYFFLRYELHLNMNFDVGGFCMLLNFLMEPGDQSSAADQESLLFLPKPGANGYYGSDLNPSEGNGKVATALEFGSGACYRLCFYIYKQNSGGKLSVSNFITSSKLIPTTRKTLLTTKERKQGSLLHAATGPLHFLHQDCWNSEICFPSPWKSEISYGFLTFLKFQNL